MRIVASPRGTGNLVHLLVSAAQAVNRANSGVREKYASHNKPSVARVATPSGLKGLCQPLMSGNRLTIFPPNRTTTPKTQFLAAVFAVGKANCARFPASAGPIREEQVSANDGICMLQSFYTMGNEPPWPCGSARRRPGWC